MDATTRPYVLGHSETELRRLAMQSAFWGELTEEVFRRAGIMGLRLDATFRAAGLRPPEPFAAARPVAGADSAGYAVFAAVTRSLLPAIEKFGIATPAEVDIDTLADRLREATVAANAYWLSPMMVGAWAQIRA